MQIIVTAMMHSFLAQSKPQYENSFFLRTTAGPSCTINNLVLRNRRVHDDLVFLESICDFRKGIFVLFFNVFLEHLLCLLQALQGVLQACDFCSGPHESRVDWFEFEESLEPSVMKATSSLIASAKVNG